MVRLLFGLLFISGTAFSQVSRNFTKKNQPLYEIGAGIISLEVPNYPGAASNTRRTIPFPWIIYRGKILQADEEGSRLKLIGSERFEVGFSGGFNFPIESDKNEARKGMPDTDALVGLGPGLLYRIPLASKLHRLTLGLGMRVNFSTTTQLSHITHQGYIVEPSVRYWFKLSEESRFTYFTSLSASASDQKYAAFFYDVDSQYVTPQREAYTSRAGMIDMALSFGASAEATRRLTVFGGVFHANLSMAANKNSPLVENEQNTGFVLGLSWMFFEKYLN
jgi:outer membrane scaffolding protein for murein synthesis (MipA/OmpV family)